MNKLAKFILRMGCLFLGFILFISFPFLFHLEGQRIVIDLSGILYGTKDNITELFTLSSYEDFVTGLYVKDGIYRYMYSMTVFLLALVLSILLGLVWALVIIVLPEKFRNSLKSLLNMTESLPDLLVIFLLQWLAFYLYQEKGMTFFRLYSGSGENPYLVPVLVVSLLPSFYLGQFLVKILESEEKRDYVLLARSKGIGRFPVLCRHLFPNGFRLFAIQLRNVLWIILGNLVMVEYVFTLKGFLYVVLFTLNGATFLFGLLLVAVPLLLVDWAIILFLTRTLKEEI